MANEALPQSSQKPQRFTTLETRDVELASRQVASLFGDRARIESLVQGSAFRYRLNTFALGRLTLIKAEVANWRLSRPLEDVINITIPLGGTLKYAAALRSNVLRPGTGPHAGVGKPGEALRLEAARADATVMYVSGAALVERAETLTGRDCSGTLLADMVDVVDLAAPMGAALARGLKTAVAEVSSLNLLGMGALAASGYEDLLLNFAAGALLPRLFQESAEPRACGTATIRQARDYIRAHAHKPIEISRLARDLGVSMRTMQVSFQRHFGISPRAYLFECRLENARRRLMTGSRDDSVTSVALESGFSDLGQFSAKYRDKFGELPSETLRLRRRSAA